MLLCCIQYDQSSAKDIRWPSRSTIFHITQLGLLERPAIGTPGKPVRRGPERVQHGFREHGHGRLFQKLYSRRPSVLPEGRPGVPTQGQKIPESVRAHFV